MSNFVSIRLMGVLLILGFGAFVSFLMYNSLVSIHRDEYSCFGGKHYINAGGRERLIGIGNLNVFYQPLRWDCESDHKYDPSKYVIQNGELVGRSQ